MASTERDMTMSKYSFTGISREDSNIIQAILDREARSNRDFDRIGMSMDLQAVHETQTLNLQRLLDSDDIDFAHDVCGISYHIDRNTGKLTRCFLPRCQR